MLSKEFFSKFRAPLWARYGATQGPPPGRRKRRPKAERREHPHSLAPGAPSASCGAEHDSPMTRFDLRPERPSRRPSPWPWLSDRLNETPEMEERRMFGCSAFYREGMLRLLLTGEDDEPWNGVCACTSRDRHEALLAEFPELSPHPVLGKWLYISCEHPAFERVAAALVELARGNDPRLGVAPRPKRRNGARGARPVKK